MPFYPHHHLVGARLRSLLAGLVVVFFALVGPPAAAQGVGSWVSPGPLAADHAKLDGITSCPKCHSPLRGVLPELCMDCHDDVAEQVKTAKGFHANKGKACATCHPDHRGRDFELAKVELSPLEHLRETGFALEGAHIRLDCAECHERGKWGDVEPECESCHETFHGETDHLDIHDCEACHDARDWVSRTVDDVFDHTDTEQTDYVLEGAHVEVSCRDCHDDGENHTKFVPVDAERCTTCHKDPHRSEKISSDCESCHNVQSWFVADFLHDLTGYHLEGLHEDVACAKCHRMSATKPIDHDQCADCHTDVHRKQFVPRDCNACHDVTTADFRIPQFDHDKTKWPLVGNHTEVECKECHGEGVKAQYLPVKHEDCDACHEDIHKGKFEPTNCSVCHVETSWEVGDFDHGRTRFPLLGKHVDVKCEECHPNEQWSGIAYASCLDCHEEQPHGTLFAGDTCDGCHAENDWVEVTFDHASETKFDLQPQHEEVACKECHEDLKAFAGQNMECVSCHRWDPPVGHYEGACEDCHRAADWRPADLGDRSHDITGYPLVDTHAQLACEDCHGPVMTPLSAGGTDCVDCHAADDSHRNMLGSMCEDCHTPTSWLRTTFRHTLTGWPLRGAHRLAACDDCHATRYIGTPDECWRCHESEAPRDQPAHQSAFFRFCDECHRPYTWSALPTTGGGGSAR